MRPTSLAESRVAEEEPRALAIADVHEGKKLDLSLPRRSGSDPGTRIWRARGLGGEAESDG